MIANDQEPQVTLERIARFQAQFLHKTETNPANYHAAASGLLAEVDRMQREVREYLSLHPAERTATTCGDPGSPSFIGHSRSLAAEASLPRPAQQSRFYPKARPILSPQVVEQINGERR